KNCDHDNSQFTSVSSPPTLHNLTSRSYLYLVDYMNSLVDSSQFPFSVKDAHKALRDLLFLRFSRCNFKTLEIGNAQFLLDETSLVNKDRFISIANSSMRLIQNHA